MYPLRQQKTARSLSSGYRHRIGSAKAEQILPAGVEYFYLVCLTVSNIDIVIRIDCNSFYYLKIGPGVAALPELAQELPFPVEYLNPGVHRISDNNFPFMINSDRLRPVKLSARVSRLAKGEQVFARNGEHLYFSPTGIDQINPVARIVNSDPADCLDSLGKTDFLLESPIGVKHIDILVPGSDNIRVAFAVK